MQDFHIQRCQIENLLKEQIEELVSEVCSEVCREICDGPVQPKRACVSRRSQLERAAAFCSDFKPSTVAEHRNLINSLQTSKSISVVFSSEIDVFAPQNEQSTSSVDCSSENNTYFGSNVS